MRRHQNSIKALRHSLARRPHRGLPDDRGLTLIELLVAMTVLGVVGMLVVVGMEQASRSYVRADDETQGLADAKTVMDRVARDIRESRGVICPQEPTAQNYSPADPGCAAHLQLWIDRDSDYVEDPDEVVVWQLQRNGEHFDVLRVAGNGNTHVVARSLIVETLFRYDTADPEDATMVDLIMHYDALIGVGVEMRTAATAARLRNA